MSVIAGSCGKSSFCKKLPDSSLILHSYQQRMEIPVAPHSHQHLVGGVNVANFGHLYECVVVSHFYLICISLTTILRKSSLLIICFMDRAFGVVSSPCPRSSRFSHMLYSKCFTVLHFTCKSVVHSVKYLD